MNAAVAHLWLLADIFSMKLFVWMFGHDGELLDSHLFFFDRYSELANFHRQHGRTLKADRFEAIAEAHYRAAPDDDPPDAAVAQAMPIPRPPISTSAVGATQLKKPVGPGSSEPAPSEPAPSAAT